MTVRVTKPPFNVREKLSELDIPVGTHGSQLMKSVDVSESFDLVKAGRKNMIINGQMWINQRFGGNSYEIPNATGGTYQLDRWAVNEATGGTVNVNMDGDPLNYPATGVAEFQKAMQIACSGTDTSMGSTENLHFFQNIEGYNTTHLQWGTVAAKPVTLSFWVKTNKPGTYCVGLENSGTDRCCIREFYHDGDHIWKKFSLTYPGCPDGTWLKTNGCGIRVRFCLASGTQYDDGVDGKWVSTDELTTGNQTNFMTSTSNRFFITGVQLEEGTVATPFEHRSYGIELSLCQRYFWAINNGTSTYHWFFPLSTSHNYRRCKLMFPTTMRTGPTASNLQANNSGGGGLGTPSGTQHSDVDHITVHWDSSGTVDLRMGDFSAEL